MGEKCRQIDFRKGMTSFGVPSVGAITPVFGDNIHESSHKDHHFRHVLKSKKNTHKHRCNRVLRKKLKNYKLRLDDREDEDILDVSKLLVSSLKIKSPISEKDSQKIEELTDFEGEFDELRPTNYLFKMVKKKIGNNRIEYILNSKDGGDRNNHDNNKDCQDNKKQTNAFQLLMDSRNKSLGTNSPGKDKIVDECDADETLEKKNNKAKRKLLLQKMAESKGVLKKKQNEEYQEACIKQKMEKRAEKLKKMILSDQKPANKFKIESKPIKTSNQHQTNDIGTGKSTSEKIDKKNKKIFQIVDIFNVLSETTQVSPEQKHLSDDDSEFLSKLSPSIKKKQSMLSYFKKLEKEPEHAPIDDENHSPIKEKLRKSKKRDRKKLSLNKNIKEDSDNTPEIEINDGIVQQVELVCTGSEEVNENEKNNYRKKTNKTKSINNNNSNTAEQVVSSESRPKRSVKRPIKYNEETFLTSSDEELHIFTPKKKKGLGSAVDDKPTKTKVNSSSNDSTKPKEKRPKVKGDLNKPVKLAPIFSKPAQTDPAALEAKQKFLQSGVPDKLKKIIKHQKISKTLATDFPVVIHVQQIDKKPLEPHEDKYNLPEVSSDEDVPNMQNNECEYSKLLNLGKESKIIQIDSGIKQSVQVLLQDLKQLYPKFPVYRTYRYLRSKRKGEHIDFKCTNFDNSIEIMNGDLDSISESPEKLNWTNKYKALSTNHIIGNFETIKELKKWLVSWTENEIKSKAKTNLDSDSSDYYQSDTDSRDSVKSMNNLLILTGPIGSGKTSCIYAVAAELSIKVIEVNVSSRRTGKIMLQDLQEATQSHKVNRGKVLDNSQKSQEKPQQVDVKTVKRKGRPKKSVDKYVNSKKCTPKVSDNSIGTQSSQESVRTCMSLILIDDADIVFEQDDGFSSAIMQLVQSSKRPVILVTSTLVCPHLQRFIQYGKVMKMYPLLPRMLGTWLDIMCLADNSMCWPGMGAKFLNNFKGDVRKAINYLQFYTSLYVSNSDEEFASQNIDNFKVNIDDENSCVSWADHEAEAKSSAESNTNGLSMILVDFEKQSNLTTCNSQSELFNIWWSIPHLLDVTDSNTKSVQSDNTFKCLEATANAIDAMSLADFYSHKRSTSYSDITSDPWFTSEMDSVSEQENFDYYYRSHRVGDEISHELVSGSIVRAQDELYCVNKTNLQTPGMMLQRQRDKIVSRHNSLTSYLNPWSVLDRRAVALDYWPACRSICRIEKDKTDNNSKRNNRFCHYLKSLSVLCKTDTFDRLGDSLCCK